MLNKISRRTPLIRAREHICVLAAEGVCLMGGALSSLGSYVGGMPYRPVGTPGGWAFAIILSALYAAFGAAARFALRRPFLSLKKAVFSSRHAAGGAQKAAALFLALLIVDFSRSVFFFCFRWMLFSLIWSAALLALAGYTARRFSRLNPAAGLLMAPYLLWLLYSVYLCYGFWALNR